MAEKVTTMVLKVDLQCSCCYKKIKKILCKFPEIQDQIYDEKQNTVTIVVVCCCPEKFRHKLCCKGGKTIKCIQIKEHPKCKPPGTCQEPEKPTVIIVIKAPPPPPPPPPPPLAFVPVFVPVCYPPICCGQCYKGCTDGPCYHGPY